MSRSRLLVCSTALASTIILGACKGTHVSDVRKDPTYDPKTMHRVFVVAVVKAPRIQEMIEDEFVRQLEATGRQAIASHTIVARGRTLDHDAWVNLINENHSDSVVLSRLTSSEVENEKDMGAKLNDTQMGSGYSGAYTTYAAFYKPASYTRDETAYVETKVFDLVSGREVWSAKSKTEIVWGGDPEPQVKRFVELLVRAAKK
jgi:hypothetical protein